LDQSEIPTYDILLHGILPNTNIQRIDLDNLGDDQLAANGHSVEPASLYAIFHQGHFGHLTSLECPTIPPDVPFPTIDALKISQARLLHSCPAWPRPVEITGQRARATAPSGRNEEAKHHIVKDHAFL